ncbi:solute:sodium symporter family transporter [Chitinophaga sp. RAB17]|uniref:solute:sodium symporter family transporter n=1 Tax=Chitinophaga sp. RAB17 TaxID=3233049 RepID=UPI003F92772A
MHASTIISFVIFVVIVTVLSWYITRKHQMKTASDVFLGSRSLNWVVIGGALFMTNISANQFIGENESVFMNNMSIMAWGVTSVFAMLFVSEFFMPVYLRIGAVTTPDFLAVRYDQTTKKIVSVVFLVSYLVNLIPAVLYGGAVAFNGIFHLNEILHISYWSTIWMLACLIAVIGYLYNVLGGLKVITMSDTVLGAGMIAGGLLLPYFGFKYLGHGDVTEGLRIVLGTDTSHLNAIGGKHDSVPFSTIFTGMLLVNIYYWGMEQFIVQQALGSVNLEQSQKGIALACLCKLLSPLMLNIPGLIAVHLYFHPESTAEIFPRLAADVLPPVYTGLIAAVVFGAALSTFNAGLSSAGTLFTMNLYKPYVTEKKGGVTDKKLLSTTWIFQVIVILIGIGIAPFIMLFKGGFYNYIQMLSGFFSIPIFTIMIVGMATRRIPAIAAKIGLGFFFVANIFFQLILDTGLHYLHLLAILFVVTAILMLIIGKFWPMAVPYAPVRTSNLTLQPWKHRHWYSAVLIILMVLLFVLFSPLGLAR